MRGIDGHLFLQMPQKFAGPFDAAIFAVKRDERCGGGIMQPLPRVDDTVFTGIEGKDRVLHRQGPCGRAVIAGNSLYGFVVGAVNEEIA